MTSVGHCQPIRDERYKRHKETDLAERVRPWPVREVGQLPCERVGQHERDSGHVYPAGERVKRDGEGEGVDDARRRFSRAEWSHIRDRWSCPSSDCHSGKEVGVSIDDEQPFAELPLAAPRREVDLASPRRARAHRPGPGGDSRGRGTVGDLTGAAVCRLAGDPHPD